MQPNEDATEKKPTWQTTWAWFGSPALNSFLSQGWEPFAVVVPTDMGSFHSYTEKVYLRKLDTP